MKFTHYPLTLVTVAASLALLSGCSADSDDQATSPTVADRATAQDEELILVDGWVKATSDSMTGVFGTLTNTTDEDLHLVRVQSGLAGHTELHVTVDDGAGGRMMQETEDGFVISAGGEHVLEPGGDHLMLMQLTDPIETGEDVDLTLVLDDGQELRVTVTARAFTGAEEHYAPDHGDHGDQTQDPEDA